MGSEATSSPNLPPAFQVELQQFDIDYIAAFDAGNAQAMAALFTEDTMLMNSLGQGVSGRSALTAMLEQAFAGPFQSATLQITPHQSKALSENVVVQQGTTRTTHKDNSATYRDFKYTKVFVRQGAAWKLAVAQFAIPDTTPAKSS